MANRNKQEMTELRGMVKDAVTAGHRNPSSVYEYLAEHNYPHELPTRATVIALLNENGVEHVKGFWRLLEKWRGK